MADFKRVTGKTGILFQMAEASLDHPKGQVDEVIYPVVGEQTLRDLVKEYRVTGRSYREKVHTVMRGSYSHHYRRMVPQLLSVLAFHSNNEQHQPVMQTLDLVQKYRGAGEAKPHLDRLGGVTWEKTKSRVKAKMRDMADELLKLYAQRRMSQGFAFSADAGCAATDSARMPTPASKIRFMSRPPVSEQPYAMPPGTACTLRTVAKRNTLGD